MLSANTLVHWPRRRVRVRVSCLLGAILAQLSNQCFPQTPIIALVDQQMIRLDYYLMLGR